MVLQRGRFRPLEGTIVPFSRAILDLPILLTTEQVIEMNSDLVATYQ